MKSTFSRQALGLFCGILVFSSLFIGLLAMYRNTLIENDQENVALNDITVRNYELNSIGIVNSLSVSDEEAKSMSLEELDGVQDVFDFEVTSNYDEDVYFEIYLTKEDFENEIDPHYVKLYLIDLDTGEAVNEINGVVPTYYDLRVATSDPMGKRVYYGSLGAYETKKYRLKMWLSDTYSISGDVSEFRVKIHTKVN